MPKSGFHSKCVLLGIILALLANGATKAQDADDATSTLTREQRIKLRALVTEASDDFTTRKFQAALSKLDLAAEILPDYPEALNLRGSILTEQGDFGRATETFNKALQVEPHSFWPKFNLGEILFLQKKYDESKAAFEKLTDFYPYTEFVQFKLVLNNLMLKDEQGAKDMIDKMKFPGETAAYYYARAAMEFARGNRNEALSWIKSADALFRREKNLFFYDSLADLGWVEKRLPR